MGCAWTAATDYALIDAVEVTNGALAGALTQSAEGPWSGIAFWHARLNEGHRLIAIGGSDNHDPTIDAARLGAIGRPTTVIHAQTLSAPALLAGLRNGRVFIDVDGEADSIMEMRMTHRFMNVAQMGGALSLPAGEIATVTVHASNTAADNVEWIIDGEAVTPRADYRSEGATWGRTFVFESDGGRHWLRANVRDARGRLVFIGNPIFVNWD